MRNAIQKLKLRQNETLKRDKEIIAANPPVFEELLIALKNIKIS